MILGEARFFQSFSPHTAVTAISFECVNALLTMAQIAEADA